MIHELSGAPLNNVLTFRERIAPIRGGGQSQASRWWVPLVSRNRYQLAVGFAVAGFLPALIRAPANSLMWTLGSTQATLVGTTIAMLGGAYTTRRLLKFPGVTALSCVLPAFAVSYLLVILAFFFSRSDYSRIQFALSFAFCVTWFMAVLYTERKALQPTYNLVPFGNALSLADLPGPNWQVASSPDELSSPASGVIADLRADLAPEWEKALARIALSGTPVYHYKQIDEALSGTVKIDHLSESPFGSLLPSLVYLRIQRLFDLVLAVIALPFFLLVLGIAAIAIKLDDGGPVFFRQSRIGYRGDVFTIFKLRTMQDATDGEAPAYTEAGDPRVTRVGRILRHYRIDELPQIFNILKGEMSWIGPRPESLSLAQEYEKAIPFYSYRHIVRPGITGWAQVHQGNVAQIPAATGKLRYDFFYIKYFSPWLDLLIVMKTIKTILSGFGAR